MAITVVAGVPQFTDDSTGLKISTIWGAPGNGTGALLGPTSYLLAGTAASLAAQKSANPTFVQMPIWDLLRRLLLSSDLTPDRLDQAAGTRSS